MQIINKTKNTILAKELIFADTPLKRMKGLLGKEEFKQGQALIIKPCNSIHTCFMHFTIDVIFVDDNNKIVKVISRLKPWHFGGLYIWAKFCIELPAGTINSSLTTEGDSITLDL
jgi:hypothetical protein